MSSFKHIGEATAEAHVKLEEIKILSNMRTHSFNKIIQELSKQIELEAIMFDEALDELMNGDSDVQPTKQDEAA